LCNLMMDSTDDPVINVARRGIHRRLE